MSVFVLCLCMTTGDTPRCVCVYAYLGEVYDYALRFLCGSMPWGVCVFVCVSVCVRLTIVCEDALRSDHLIADMADNKTKILQCWKLAVDKHLWKKSRGHISEIKGAQQNRLLGQFREFQLAHLFKCSMLSLYHIMSTFIQSTEHRIQNIINCEKIIVVEYNFCPTNPSSTMYYPFVLRTFTSHEKQSCLMVQIHLFTQPFKSSN